MYTSKYKLWYDFWMKEKPHSAFLGYLGKREQPTHTISLPMSMITAQVLKHESETCLMPLKTQERGGATSYRQYESRKRERRNL